MRGETETSILEEHQALDDSRPPRKELPPKKDSAESFRRRLLTDTPFSFKEVERLLKVKRPNTWPDKNALMRYMQEGPRTAIINAEQHRKEIEKSGGDVAATTNQFKKFEQFDDFEITTVDQLPGWKKIQSYFEKKGAKNLGGIHAVVIDDADYWKTFYGSNPSKSSPEQKTIILKKEIFMQSTIADEQLSWLAHEMAHLIVYDTLDDATALYIKSVHENNQYTKTANESVAFQTQLDFLKSIGKTKGECIAFLKNYADESFGEDATIDAEQQKLKKEEFSHMMRYLDGVYG